MRSSDSGSCYDSHQSATSSVLDQELGQFEYKNFAENNTLSYQEGFDEPVVQILQPHYTDDSE